MDEFGLAKIYSSEGLAPGAMRGYNEGINQGRTLADTAYQQAQTQRFNAETPTYLQQKQADLRKTQLGNRPAEEMDAAGVYAQDAQLAKTKKQIEIEQAQEIWKNLGPEKQAQAQAQARSMSNELTTIALEAFTSSGKIVDAFNAQAQHIQANAHKLPAGMAEKMLAEVEKGLVKADQQYGRNPQAWYQLALKQAQQQSNIKLTTDPAHQGKMQLNDADNASAMERARLQGEYGLRGDQIRASAAKTGQDNLTKTELENQLWQQYNSNPPGSAEREQARIQINQMKGGKTVTREGILGPQTTTTETLPPDPKPVNPKVRDYLQKATSKEDFARRVKDLRDKGWTKEQINAANQ